MRTLLHSLGSGEAAVEALGSAEPNENLFFPL
jgi:hypothetical protein